jgi:endonuclease/exonuclease/phosphatase family metal-dependent hydrolase
MSGLAILVRGEAASARLALTSHPADGERIAQRLDVVVGGRSLRILNLHLTHLRDAAELRATQLREALDWACADLSGGLVVAGDLNATAADPALAPLGLGPRPPTLQGARVGMEPPRAMAIDHCVLLRAGPWRETGSLRGCDAPDPDGWFPSDHAAVGIRLA